jgi:A/G-specific adenine glycosylase
MKMRALVALPVETRLAASQASRNRKDLSAFRRALLRWYDKHRRDLPWRRTRDPYRIWLSEIMLQQTRVAAVLDHYRTFLDRFPSLDALAAASEDAVLAAWSGLGYYRRARMLHRSAKEVVGKQGGRFPRTAETLQSLPGIGRYTAAAIASIAFEEPVAAVDGNVERVVQRLTGHDLARHQIWHGAQWLLSTSRPGDFNQAMMELGATVCLPGDPKCSVCPVCRCCATARMERQACSPARTNKVVWRGHSCPRAGSTGDAYGGGQKCPPHTTTSRRQLKEETRCLLTQRDGHIRLVQRSRRSSLMPGMWELPVLPEKPNRKQVIAPWRSFRHSITVTDYTVSVHRSQRVAGQGKWIPVANIPHLPITGLTRKILKAAGII